MSIEDIYSLYLSSSKICTDTRNISNNVLFFCLKGENYDGNIFAEKALNLGANYVIVDNYKYFKNKSNYILVKNSLKTLQELAKFHRSKLKTKIIAITGSNGKTTSKELIYSVLSQKFNTVSTIGNYNNHIGVPISILSISDKTEIGIIEMGANHLNEIKFLCEIANPQIGYITNFGKAHLEGFGSEISIIKGKSELYNYLKETNGLAFINGDDKKQLKLTQKNKRFIFGSSEKADLNITPKNINSNKIILKYNNFDFKSNMIGSYNVSNVSVAIAFGLFFEIPKKIIMKGLKKYSAINNRSQWVKKGSNLVLMDAYNANPSSMKASIDAFIENTKTNRIIILGDMEELGKYSKSEHQKIANKLEKIDIELVILIGKIFSEVDYEKKNFKKFDNSKDASKFLNNKKWFNKNFLLKGSRKNKLEEIIKF